MADDDRALKARLEMLEREVKADADHRAALKSEALARLRAQRAEQSAAATASTTRAKSSQVDEPVATKPSRGNVPGLGDISDMLALANKAQGVKSELARPKGDGKSWPISAGLSLVLGPLGWLYAGSFREAIPAGAAYVAAAYVVSKILPTFLLMPVLLFALPLSAIAGLVYALQYNRTGKRQRLFGNSDKTIKATLTGDVKSRKRLD